MLFFSEKHKAKKRCQKGLLPDFVCQYLEAIQRANYKKPIEQARFVVFDTETTGLEPKKDKIISIGAIALEQLTIEVADSMEVLVEQNTSGSKESIPIHQILPSELQGANLEVDAIRAFLDFARADVLVAHFAHFDVDMVSRMMRPHFGLGLLNPSIDTIKLARRLEHGPNPTESAKSGDYTLDKLCDRYNVDMTDRHNAAGDALATAKLLQKLLVVAQKRGFRYVRELIQ